MTTTQTATQTPTATQFIAPTSKRKPSEFALVFAELLTAKFSGESQYVNKVFTVEGGNTMDRIVQHTVSGQGGSVHAFVRKEDGAVFKAAGYKQPAKGVRYTSIFEAVDAADVHGSYLYL